MRHAAPRFAAALVAASGIAGCAGYHAVPPASYSTADTVKVIRVAFDQDGDIYPTDPNTYGLPIPPQPKNRNVGFGLRTEYGRRKLAYDPAVLTAATTARIAAALATTPRSRLVVLIHGFNNSYADADATYADVRAAIAAADPAVQNVYLQVYWDGLFKGRGSAPAPIAYFADALTYSNHAGQCGLRRVMAGLPARTDVTFVTHSRGAAVALAAGTDPRYDPVISSCSPPPRPNTGQPGDVRLIAYAPAVGRGHFADALGKPEIGHYDYFDRIAIGFNASDPALNKQAGPIKLGTRRRGDTSLGADLGYLNGVEAASRNRLTHVEFTQPAHAWTTYLADRKNSECLMWAGRLIGTKPATCTLTRD